MLLKISGDKVELDIDVIQTLQGGYNIADYDCIPSIVKDKTRICDLTIQAVKSADIPDNVKVEISLFMDKNKRVLSFDW